MITWDMLDLTPRDARKMYWKLEPHRPHWRTTPWMIEKHRPQWLCQVDKRCGTLFVVEFDREVLSVNGAVEYRLEDIPHCDWIHSCNNGEIVCQTLVSGIAPGARKSLSAALEVASSCLGRRKTNLEGIPCIIDGYLTW